MNPAPIPSPAADKPDSDYLTEDLRWAVTLVEDWLLHASPETLDELADFAYGPTPSHDHRSHDHLRWIVELLGVAAARLRATPGPSAPAAEPSR
jgi:hypothetical protein